MENTHTNKNLSLTIEYVRHKFGRKSEKLSDKQIIDLLNMLRFLCNKTIDSVVHKTETN